MLETIKTTDYEELSEAQKEWTVFHRPVTPHQFEGKLSVGKVGGIQVDYEQWNTSLVIEGSSPTDHICICVPLNDKSTYLSEGTDIGLNQIDIYSPGKSIFAVTKPNSTIVTISINLDAISQYEQSPFVNRILHQNAEKKSIRSNRHATDSIRRHALLLKKICSENTSSHKANNQLLDDTILTLDRAFTRQAEKHSISTSNRYAIAISARDYILDRLYDPPTILEICAFLNKSERTLRYSFQSVYGISPSQFVKTQRLYAVNRELKSASANDRISLIAMRYGFWELGYFARDYKAMFGELPSNTLQKQH